MFLHEHKLNSSLNSNHLVISANAILGNASAVILCEYPRQDETNR